MSKNWPLLAVFCPLLSLAQAWSDPFTLYADAQTSIAAGDLKAARVALGELAERNITPKGFWFLYGVSLLGTDELAPAEEALLKALEEDPTNGAAHFYLGLIALAKRDAGAAKERLLSARSLLSPDDPLMSHTEKLLASFQEEPRRVDLSLKVATQGDSNPLLSNEANASGRILLDGSAAIQQKLGDMFSVQASLGSLGALPIVNGESITATDPFGFSAALSAGMESGPLRVGASGFGRLLRRDLLREELATEFGALLLTQREPLKLAYRITQSNFSLAEAEGTAFDQDNLTQEVSFTLQSKAGLSLGALASQSEADGNSLDRQGASLQAGFHRPIQKTTLRAFVDAGLMRFPNSDTLREDQRLVASASVAQKIKATTFSLSYVGFFNQSTDVLFSYTRHLLTLEAQWQL